MTVSEGLDSPATTADRAPESANQAGLGVSAVIVNYNGAECLPACILSLKNEHLVRQIIVVDNGSTDGSEQWLKEQHPDITLIESGANLGFGRGCNLGAKAATEPLILLLNYDAELAPGLDSAIEQLDRFPETGLVGGRLVSSTGMPQPSVGYPHTPFRFVVSWSGLGRLLPWMTQFKRDIDHKEFYSNPHAGVVWVCGALMLVRRDAWASVDGMDPGYFLYLEDVDFCDRLTKAGWRLDYLPTFFAYHEPRMGSAVVSARALLATVDSSRLYISTRRGDGVARLMCAGLGVVFLLRAFILALCIFRPAPLREGTVFLKGAVRAFKLALGQTFPWGPPC